jgi:hypothetical protein
MTWTNENEKRLRADLAAALEFAREQGREPRSVAVSYVDALGAVAEIERLMGELAVSTAENASLMQSSLDEIGRLTTALEQRRAPADASLEARAEVEVRTAADIVSDLLDFAEAREWSDQIHDYGDYFYAGCDACEARESDGEHGPRCTRKALFLEARAFIEAERSAVVRADWTPERIRETRERCERATPGPWRTVDRWDGSEVRSDPGTRVIVAVDLCAEDAAFIAHAREDLPAALAWGEQQSRIAAGNAALEASQRAEIERLTAELAARAPATPAERTFPRVTLSTVKPGSVIEIASGDIGLVLDGCYGEAPRYVAWVATGHVDTMPADATVSLRATPAELDALTSADASRPGLTEEQARRDFEASIRDAVAKGGPYGNTHAREAVAALDAALLRASRGETGPAADQVAPLPDSWRCEECKETFARCTCKHGDPEHSSNLGPGIDGAPIRVRPTPGRFDVPIVQAPPAGSWQSPRCDKGHVARPGAPCPICRRASLEAALHDPETAAGAAAILADMPPPSGLTAAMHDAAQRPSMLPASAFGEWPEPEADERDPISLGERLPAAREPIAP